MMSHLGFPCANPSSIFMPALAHAPMASWTAALGASSDGWWSALRDGAWRDMGGAESRPNNRRYHRPKAAVRSRFDSTRHDSNSTRLSSNGELSRACCFHLPSAICHFAASVSGPVGGRFRRSSSQARHRGGRPSYWLPSPSFISLVRWEADGSSQDERDYAQSPQRQRAGITYMCFAFPLAAAAALCGRRDERM